MTAVLTTGRTDYWPYWLTGLTGLTGLIDFLRILDDSWGFLRILSIILDNFMNFHEFSENRGLLVRSGYPDRYHGDPPGYAPPGTPPLPRAPPPCTPFPAPWSARCPHCLCGTHQFTRLLLVSTRALTDTPVWFLMTKMGIIHSFISKSVFITRSNAAFLDKTVFYLCLLTELWQNPCLSLFSVN